jgi:hypothetical protein
MAATMKTVAVRPVARLSASVKQVKAAPVATANRMMVWRPDNNK